MHLTSNWTALYTESDSFRSDWRKGDLVYLLNKYGVKVNSFPPSKRELTTHTNKQLNRIWKKIKPFEFGKEAT